MHAQQGSSATADPRHWISRRWFTASGALVAELQPGVEPLAVFERLARRRHCLFLDSAVLDGPEAGDSTAHQADSDGIETPRLGRYSYVAADPVHTLHVEDHGDGRDVAQISDAFRTLRSLLADLACATIPGLPPFQGGVAGLVSFGCGLARLGIGTPRDADDDDGDAPLLSLHVYDLVCAFDHDARRGWIISQGVPARGPTGRRMRAAERLESLLAMMAEPSSTGFQPPGVGTITSTRSREDYMAMVREGIELILAGDIFQVNLAQRLRLAAAIDPVHLHLRSRQLNPAPFAGFFDAGRTTIVSMSPERLLQVERGTVRMHPIKGTRRMLASPEADLYAGEELEQSSKDRAENVMIVDLVRNDLSRVCVPESVRVEALCRLERYRYVQHLVSIVAGRLRPGLTALDALDAAIPGGSVTGAPKHRACEIIGQLEGFPRGAYCGSLGFIGFDGSADFNLLIRTFTVTSRSIRFAVGGGITAGSDPAAEYAETLHKAEGMLRVLASFSEAGGEAAVPAEASS